MSGRCCQRNLERATMAITCTAFTPQPFSASRLQRRAARRRARRRCRQGGRAARDSRCVWADRARARGPSSARAAVTALLPGAVSDARIALRHARLRWSFSLKDDLVIWSRPAIDRIAPWLVRRFHLCQNLTFPFLLRRSARSRHAHFQAEPAPARVDICVDV